MHLLLVTEARKGGLEPLVEPLEPVEQPGALRFVGRVLPGDEFGVGLLIEGADVSNQPAQVLEMAGAAFNELVHDDAVKALLGWHGQQLLRQRQVLFAGKTKTVDEPPRLLVGGFDAPANLHFLLARQQRHPAHLPQVHPHRVIQNVVASPFLLLARLERLAPIHLGGLDDVNVQVPQLGENLIQVSRRNEIIRQGLIEIVVGQIALLLGEAQQVFDLCGEVQAGLAGDQAE